MNKETIIQLLPYQTPFLFVEELTHVSETGAEGFYSFKEDEFFYEGHFKDNPITPGVILTEVMAQIGVVCLGIYLLKEEVSENQKPQIALTSNEVDFFFDSSFNSAKHVVVALPACPLFVPQSLILLAFPFPML